MRCRQPPCRPPAVVVAPLCVDLGRRTRAERTPLVRRATPGLLYNIVRVVRCRSVLCEYPESPSSRAITQARVQSNARE